MNEDRPLSTAVRPAPGGTRPTPPERGNEPSPETREPLTARLGRIYQGRWRWTVALGVALSIPLGILGWRFGGKTYAGRAEVHVAPYADDYGFATPDERTSFGFGSYDAFIDTQMQFLHMRRVMERAMDSTGWRGLGRSYSDEALQKFSASVQISRKGELLTIEFIDPDPNVAMVGARSVVDAYTQLSSEEDSQRGKDKLDFLQAELVRSINRLSDFDTAIKNKLQNLKGHENFGVEDLLPLFAAKLSEATGLEGRLRDVRWELAIREKNVQPTSRPASATTQPVAPFSTTAANSDGTNKAGPAELSAEEIALENNQMAVYFSQRREIENTLGRLKLTYFPDHPIVKAADAELETINGAIHDFAAQYNARRAKLGPSVDPTSTVALRRLETNLAQSLGDTNNQLESIARLKREVLGIREQIEEEKLNRDDLVKRIAAQDRLSRTPGRIQVLEMANMPKEPYLDSRPRLAALGSAGGLAIGFGAVLAIGLFERRLRIPEDTSRFGLGDRPAIGLLPQIPDDLTDPEQVAQAAHCVHGIRTSLQLWYGWISNPVFAVSGAVAGTGKTTLTLALGLSFANARSRTLLIDLDLIGGGLTRRTEAVRRRPIGQVLRRAGLLQEPQLHEALAQAAESKCLLGETLVRLGHVRDEDVSTALRMQQSDALGVLDVFEGARLEDCVVATEVQNLAILPLGRARSHHIGAVSPLGVQRLIDAARATYDVVLIDTGPVLGSLEGATAAAAADGVIVAVSCGDSRAALARCAARLQSVGARVAGVVFNRAKPRHFNAQDQSSSGSWSGAATEGRSGEESSNDQAAERAAESWHGKFGPFGRAVALAARQSTGMER